MEGGVRGLHMWAEAMLDNAKLIDPLCDVDGRREASGYGSPLATRTIAYDLGLLPHCFACTFRPFFC
jgi:hypothetical protein